MKRQGKDTPAAIVSCVAGIGLSAVGVSLIVPQLRAGAEIAEASRLTVVEGGVATRDWSALASVNPRIAAWLSVDGTTISTPVVTETDELESGWYLSHSFTDKASDAGCPYLIAALDPAKPVHVVFGHHVSLTRLAFSELAERWEQEAFDGLGACLWETPINSESFAPLCAARVLSSDELLLSVGEVNEGTLTSWLERLCAQAQARAPTWKECCQSAREAVVLVTCSSPLPGQEERCAVAFVSE